MIGTVLESSRSIFSENQICINKNSIFYAFLEPKRYITSHIAFWSKNSSIPCGLQNDPKFQKFYQKWKVYDLSFPKPCSECLSDVQINFQTVLKFSRETPKSPKNDPKCDFWQNPQSLENHKIGSRGRMHIPSTVLES